MHLISPLESIDCHHGYSYQGMSDSLGQCTTIIHLLSRSGLSIVVESIELHQDTWLPALNCRLPGLWVDEAFINDKAAASDDKKVEHSMWNQRITLLFPTFHP